MGTGAINKTANKSGMAVQDLKEAKAITKIRAMAKNGLNYQKMILRTKLLRATNKSKGFDSLQAMEKVYAPKVIYQQKALKLKLPKIY